MLVKDTGSRVPDQGACLLRMSRTIAMQGFIDLAIVVREKPTLVKFGKVNGA